MKIQLYNARGFTLIEVMIAIVILSIGILGTAKLQLSFLQSNSKARIITIGSAQSQEIIEEMTNWPYAAFVDTDGNGTGEDVDRDGVDDDGGNFGLDHNEEDFITPNNTQDDKTVRGDYTFYWNVAVDHPAESLKTINVMVKWDEKNNRRGVNYTFIKGPM